jgi:aryl-alcohol dehydrogenase-like predicted oxidoreductase
VGIGAWSWGDKSNYWTGWEKAECQKAFDASMDAGLTFVDTAEVYGFGQSERFLGEFMKQRTDGAVPQVATKYAPLPWRQSSSSVVSALDASLERLGVSSIDLYIQHWPGFFLNAFSNPSILDGLQLCLESGKTKAVGVSNFNEKRVRDAAKFFEHGGACLSSNQVQYSLLYREPERNGVLEACRENGVSLVAYSPLCQGMLT